MNLSKKLREKRIAAERVEELRERIQRLRDSMTRITPRYDAEGGGSGAEDKMMAYAARLDRLERDLTKASRRAYRVSMDALEAVGQLPDPQATVILCRDFLGMSWQRTAGKAGLSIRQCHRIRDMALGYGKKKGG